jgi:predicted membrane protein
METQQSKINPVTPENPSQPEREFRRPESGRVIAGLVVVTVGAVLLARNLDLGFPEWIFSWPMVLIAFGVFVGAKHSFRNPVWILPVLFGVGFLINNEFHYFGFAQYFWPILIIALGVVMILKNNRRSHSQFRKNWQDQGLNESSTGEDILDCVTVFGGVKKHIISKDFRGGEAITFFGGTELNLMQADTTTRVVLDLTQVFGGTKLIIPPHWKVNAEDMVTIFGGLNDKRPMPLQTTTSESKIIVLKGTCIFGGIDIKSY